MPETSIPRPPAPSPPRGRGLRVAIAIAAVSAVYYWANLPSSDVQKTGPYEPAPPPAAPAEDVYESREIPPFSIAIDEVPMDENTRWGYETSFGQLITIDYLASSGNSDPNYRMAVRSINHNPLYTMHVFRDGDRIVERTESADGPLGMTYEFPIALGKSWTFVTGGRDANGAAVEVTYTVTVEAAEEITVPTGTYSCLRIRSAAAGSDSPGTVIWYAPNTGTVRLRAADGGTAELIYFGAIPEAD